MWLGLFLDTLIRLYHAFMCRKVLLRVREGEGNRRKRKIVRDLWIASGALMLILNSITWVIVLLLLTTFMAFIILDETG